MELSLSLGESRTPFLFLDKATKFQSKNLGFCIGLGGGAELTGNATQNHTDARTNDNNGNAFDGREHGARSSSDPPFHLDLLNSSVARTHHPSSQLGIPWLTSAFAVERASPDEQARGLDVNRGAEDGPALSSPNSAMSSLQMEFCLRNNGGDSGKVGNRDAEVDGHERGGSRGLSDDDENGSTRKKLRLSKEQSAFLEENFKEHSTLNPKQKEALAKQLNLLPRQVEVWFQNRRARTKLKQTEVDCEYLKRCCETLTEENRRLHKELQELRALKSSQPFYMQLPATTLTMCPSCERVATNSSSSSVTALGIKSSNPPTPQYSSSINSGNSISGVNATIPLDLSLSKPQNLGEPDMQAI